MEFPTEDVAMAHSEAVQELIAAAKLLEEHMKRCVSIAESLLIGFLIWGVPLNGSTRTGITPAGGDQGVLRHTLSRCNQPSNPRRPTHQSTRSEASDDVDTV